MTDWYTSIKNKIDACPTSTCTTCTTFENEDKKKIGQIVQIDSLGTEKQFLQGGFCPLQYLNERDVGINEVCPERGLHLVAGYTLSQDLKHLIAFWALGQFDRLLAAIHEHRPIKKRVIVSSLNRYRLPVS